MSNSFKGRVLSGLVGVFILIGLITYRGLVSPKEYSPAYTDQMEDFLSKPLLEYLWPEPDPREEGAGLYEDPYLLRMRI